MESELRKCSAGANHHGVVQQLHNAANRGHPLYQYLLSLVLRTGQLEGPLAVEWTPCQDYRRVDRDLKMANRWLQVSTCEGLVAASSEPPPSPHPPARPLSPPAPNSPSR